MLATFNINKKKNQFWQPLRKKYMGDMQMIKKTILQHCICCPVSRVADKFSMYSIFKKRKAVNSGMVYYNLIFIWHMPYDMFDC
jgi:hypothetical protein